LDDDYLVIVRQRAPSSWGWRILRRSKPLGVKLADDGFESSEAAKRAGEKVLKELLEAIARETDCGASDP
jgi:hypothetical protein